MDAFVARIRYLGDRSVKGETGVARKIWQPWWANDPIFLTKKVPDEALHGASSKSASLQDLRTVIEQLLGNRPFQIGIVVRDVREAAARYTKLWGVDDWMIVENGPQNMHGLHYMGEPADFSMRLALTGSDPQLELLQPLEGPSILADWLERRGEGLHHMGVEVASVDETIAQMAAVGIKCVQHGYGFGADGSGAFAYFDTEAELSCYLEAIEPANE